MNTNIKEPVVTMADVYKQYIQGWAYIPLQDLVRYERAYKEIYEK